MSAETAAAGAAPATVRYVVDVPAEIAAEVEERAGVLRTTGADFIYLLALRGLNPQAFEAEMHGRGIGA